MAKEKTNTFNLAYLLWKFPVLSETFILRRISVLKKEMRNTNLIIYSIRRPNGLKIHELAKEFVNPNIYIPTIFNVKFIFIVFAYVVVHPIKVGSTILQLLTETPSKISVRLSLYYILQSIYCSLVGIYMATKFTKQNISHIHTHFAHSSGLIARIASKLTGIPYSITTHAMDIYQNPNKKLVTQLIKESAFSITISEFNKRYLLSLDEIDPQKINVIHSAIDVKKFSHRKRQPRLNNKFKILTVGRLGNTKGIEETILACAQLRADLEYEYNIIGDGSLRKRLENLIQQNNLSERISLLGAKTEKEVIEYLQNADLFVLFCKIANDGRMDGIPNVLMEAMAMEIPVISTRISGIPELVRDGAGILVEPGDISGLRDAITNIANISLKKRLEMGEKGRKVVIKEFNIRTEVTKLIKLFSD